MLVIAVARIECVILTGIGVVTIVRVVGKLRVWVVDAFKAMANCVVLAWIGLSVIVKVFGTV